jgi:uncharacterized RmlC-like cupin family protein
MQLAKLRVFVPPALLGMVAAVVIAQTPQPISNDQAKVVTAVDQPHKKGKAHQHEQNRVMIYLNAGRQEITPVGGKTQVLEFKAGDVKWSPASGMHTSEIVSDQPVTMVEVLVMKDGVPGKKVTTALDPLKVDPTDYKLVLENDQVRVIRVKMAPGRKVPLHEHELNRVVVYLTDQNGSMTTPDGKTDVGRHKAGEASWGGPTKHTEQNLKDTPFEAVVVEFKS